MLPKTVSNSDIFTIYSKDLMRNYFLYGFISYWAGHYVCFFQSTEKEEGSMTWYFLDDKNIVRLRSWKEVIIHSIKNHYHPILLFYKITESKSSIYEQGLTDKDYINLISHCEKVDNENEKGNLSFNQVDNNTNTMSLHRTFTSKIRPMIEMKKSTDADLIRSIRNLQKLDEIKKKGSKDPSSISKTATIKTLKDEEEKKIEIENLNKVELSNNEWICKKCENINNYSTFQCNKCKEINIKVYEKIVNKKEFRSVKINTETSSKKFDSLSKTFDSFITILPKKVYRNRL